MKEKLIEILKIVILITIPLATGLAALGLIILTVLGFGALRKQWLQDKIALGVVLFCLLAGLLSALLVAKDKLMAGQGLLSLFVAFWLYFVGRHLYTPRDLSRLLPVMVPTLGFLSLLCVIQGIWHPQISFRIFQQEYILFGPENGNTVLTFSVNAFAPLNSFAFILGSSWWFKKQSRPVHKVGGEIVALLSLLALVLLGRRNGAISLIAGGVVLILLVNWKVLGLLVGNTIVALILAPHYLKRFFSIFNLNYPSNLYRILLSISSMAMIRHYPLLGVGPENFPQVYPAYRLPQETEFLRGPHNIYFYMATQWGLPVALVLFGWIIWRLVHHLKESKSFDKRVIIAVIVSFLIYGLFDDIMFVFAIAGLSWLFLGMLEIPTD